MAKKLTLEEHADQIRDDLKVPHQSEVFAQAVEAGYRLSADKVKTIVKRATDLGE